MSKTNQEPNATSSNISLIYKKLLQTFRKSISLAKNLFLVNSLVKVWFGEYYDNTAQKMKFSVKNLFGKCDQIRSFLRIWSHLLEKNPYWKTSFFVHCKSHNSYFAKQRSFLIFFHYTVNLLLLLNFLLLN